MIIKISAPGKDDSGYILLDVLVALFVAAIGFGVIFSAFSTAVEYTVKRESQLTDSRVERNNEANDFETIISY